MKKSEIFDIVLAKVADVCEVSGDLIINGSKLQAVVDARLLVVQYLRRIGLSSDDIALTTLRRKSGDPNLVPPIGELRKKSKGIDKMFSNYSLRCMQSYAFCLMSKDISDFCRERYKDFYLSWMKRMPE